MSTTTTRPPVSYTTVNDGDSCYGQVTIGDETVDLYLHEATRPMLEDDPVDTIVVDGDGNLMGGFTGEPTPDELQALVVDLLYQGMHHRAACSEGR